MEQTFSLILSILTIIAHALIVLLFFAWLSDKIAGTRLIERSRKIISPYALIILFLIPVVGIFVSLTLSGILDFEPCQLCWYQRMMMYPQAILALVALIRKQRMIIPYLIMLSVIGAIISAYQYYGQMITQYGSSIRSVFCAADSASCAEIYVLQFGYITIPLMTLTAFVLIITISLIAKNNAE
ncbi:MAG: disulfide bond formation protein B [Parcubacteria group bacterium CG_4_9_14_0_2_um_filter_41_8]|nr:MAG: disulfide bond formation protein B [Parcubacteria group bacterium CG11_big_fil_rev_8_21_14_0_20_41_14]PIR57552.1 MAG: disulfide bond formation protein B [Parcubacteria group bacterium CG10_big_fil_rev_8_21_14_0_10_41_35]PJC40431.1 MAG: disulfide bond formation protein B [Parcubacteria group bacterium CG_4_9_14_0_2_um_filter_41_8]